MDRTNPRIVKTTRSSNRNEKPKISISHKNGEKTEIYETTTITESRTLTSSNNKRNDMGRPVGRKIINTNSKVNIGNTYRSSPHRRSVITSTSENHPENNIYKQEPDIYSIQKRAYGTGNEGRNIIHSRPLKNSYSNVLNLNKSKLFLLYRITVLF